MEQITEKRFRQVHRDPQRLLRRLQDGVYSKQSLAGIKFVSVSKYNIEIVVCIDPSFAVNKDNPS